VTEREFWQLAYLVALHNTPAPAKAAAAADKSVQHLVERHGKEAGEQG
tara:strand:- start:7 stop:150 length:144 start_codon:yes stop_codon:yes gene_type:complete